MSEKIISYVDYCLGQIEETMGEVKEALKTDLDLDVRVNLLMLLLGLTEELIKFEEIRETLTGQEGPYKLSRRVKVETAN